MPGYFEGQSVEYRPIGGKSDNVAHSTGVIEKIHRDEEGKTMYTIKNDNTGKSTAYQEMNIVGRA